MQPAFLQSRKTLLPERKPPLGHDNRSQAGQHPSDGFALESEVKPSLVAEISDLSRLRTRTAAPDESLSHGAQMRGAPQGSMVMTGTQQSPAWKARELHFAMRQARPEFSLRGNPMSQCKPSQLPDEARTSYFIHPASRRRAIEAALVDRRRLQTTRDPALLFAVAQPPVDRAEDVGIVVGPDPLAVGRLGLGPFVR